VQIRIDSYLKGAHIEPFFRDFVAAVREEGDRARTDSRFNQEHSRLHPVHLSYELGRNEQEITFVGLGWL
jgi:hypothetical protein